MKTVRELYADYRIMPSLQMHQLRVAAVVQLVCDNFSQPINKQDIVVACLFHDMGNIIKSDLTRYPEFLAPEGLEYWEGVKADFVQKYGNESHTATAAIAREIGLPENSVGIIERTSFSQIANTLRGNSFEQKIAEYADCRSGTHGIVSIKERFADAVKRYVYRYASVEEAHAKYAEHADMTKVLETQIFEHCSIAPPDINDVTVLPLLKELSEYPVP